MERIIMNQTLETLNNHRSIRSYTDQPVDKETLDSIIKAVQQSPNSINGQQVSLVVTRDAAIRQKISDIAGGQPWIAQAPVFITVVMDFHKTTLGVKKAGGNQVIHQDVEGIVVGAVDAGIILGNLMTVSESLGLGIVPIGAIRANPQAMIHLLKLPPLTFPLVGMCLGHVADASHKKPRLPLKTFVHDEHYDSQGMAEAIDQYDVTLKQHWQTVARGDGQIWSHSVTMYEKIYFPLVQSALHDQGFLISDKIERR